ncbi:TonB-dependent receptor domain-containing protein [candidate division KSB1 bacterium]
MKKMNCFSGIALILFSLFFVLSDVFADGTTGTLAGYVKDKKTKEPLPGAQVIILNTKLGAAADKDGFYIVNHIPAGTYTVKITHVGYTPLIVKDVNITADQRTSMNFEIEEGVIEGEEIVITARRPLIQSNVTSTSHYIEGKNFNQLPVEDFAEMLNLLPGVVNEHFRGGRSSEVLYLVDGIPVQEALRGGKGALLPNNSIVEMTVHTGGFNAEYGRAMSGVVNLVTKEGGRTFNGYGLFTSDMFSKYIKNHEFDNYYKYEFNFGGPIGNNINYFLSSDLRLTDTKHRNDAVFDQEYRFFNSPVRENFNTMGKVSIKINENMKLIAQGLYSNWVEHEYEHRWRFNLQGLPEMKKHSYRGSLNFIHMISSSTYYDFSLSALDIFNKVLGKPSEEYKKVELYDPTDPLSYVRKGDKQWWQDNEEITAIGKFSLTSQINRYHQIRFGFEFIYYDLYVNDVKYYEVNVDSSQNLLGYNVVNNKYHYFPKAAAAFVQDKIEYEGFVGNFGIRFDYFDPTAERPAAELPTSGSTSERKSIPKIKASSKFQISPRVGITFPITQKEIVHLNYGWFFQMPLFSYLFTNLNYDFSGYWPLVGDPDLKPEKTIAYEVGYQRMLGENAVISVTGFSKDISNLVDTKTYALPDTFILGHPARRGYAEYVNLAYGRAIGLEFALLKRYSNYYSTKLSYTFMKASGSSSAAGEGYNWMIWGVNVPKDREYPLSWDQRHTFIGEFNFKIPNSWGIYLIYKLNSPLPYTETNSIRPNDERMKWREYLDIKLSRELRFILNNNRAGYLMAYLEVKNALNKTNILWVDPNGLPGGKLSDPTAFDLGRRIRLGVIMKF